MNRLDLSHVLASVLPHYGTLACPGVGLEAGGGRLRAYATDTYTVGIARCYYGGRLACHLPPTEAKDLLRFIKPTRKSHEVEPVTLLYQDDELHVGLPEDSAVFSTAYAKLGLDTLHNHLVRMMTWPKDQRELIVNPDLAARFSKAKRDPLDRMHLWPVQSKANESRHGCAVVSVGSDFIGAVAGIEYQEEPSLLDWFTEETAA